MSLGVAVLSRWPIQKICASDAELAGHAHRALQCWVHRHRAPALQLLCMYLHVSDVAARRAAVEALLLQHVVEGHPACPAIGDMRARKDQVLFACRIASGVVRPWNNRRCRDWILGPPARHNGRCIDYVIVAGSLSCRQWWQRDTDLDHDLICCEISMGVLEPGIGVRIEDASPHRSRLRGSRGLASQAVQPWRARRIPARFA